METWHLSSVERLRTHLGEPPDLVCREVPHAGAVVLFLESLVDPDRVGASVIGRLVRAAAPPHDPLPWLCSTVAVPRVEPVADLEAAGTALLDGDALVVVPAAAAAFRLTVRGAEHRPPDVPETEVSIRGPRDGFTETLLTNLALVRGRVKDPLLQVEQHAVGTRSRTRVLLVYHRKLADPTLVREVRRRLRQIRTDRIISSGQLEQWLEDSPHSLYPQIQPTERPDKVVAALLEGRMALLVDGDPFALLAPAVMVSFFQTPDDYSHRWIYGSLLRWVRLAALTASLVVPSLYVATTMYNPEQLPLKIALTLAQSREGIPFPIVLEALVMEAMVELIREAGTRMPRPLGEPLGILGGLVIGELAVRAHLVSATMVVLVGLTSLGSFAIPSHDAALTTRMLRFPLVVLTGIFGLTGMLFFVVVVLAHLCTLRSVGVPYLSPFAQLAYRDWADTLVRAPVAYLRHQPDSYANRSGSDGQAAP